MQKVDLSKCNPFSSYKSNFGSYFSFGKKFDDWVCETMLDAILPENSDNLTSIKVADIGAGSCYWATAFAMHVKNLEVIAVDPSEPLILEQASNLLELDKNSSLGNRIRRLCMTGQNFAVLNEYNNLLDTIYFMQSAHYIGHDEFESVFLDYAKKLKPGSGKIVIQARNMTPEWYPWAFPFEWKERVETQLHATSMFGRADRYVNQFKTLGNAFKAVSLHERKFMVEVEKEDYWDRLENRWIPTFMSKDIIPPELHREGIDQMKRRFNENSETHVSWVEKYAIVVATV